MSRDYVYIKGIDPTTLIGRTIKCKQDDCTVLHLNQQHDKLRDQKFRVIYNDTYHTYLPTEKVDDLMTYNNIMNHLHTPTNLRMGSNYGISNPSLPIWDHSYP